MSAVAETTDTTTTSDDPFAGVAERLTTLLGAPERESATRDEEPASEGADDTGEQADTPQPEDAPDRDERGRFRPKEGAEAAETGDQAAESGEKRQEAAGESAETGAKAAKTGGPQTPEDWRAEAEKARRELASVRGNVDNAARQAAERARQEALAEAERDERQRITTLLNEYQQAGHDVSEARRQWQAQWDAQDREKREKQDHQRRAGLMLDEVEVRAGTRLNTLYEAGTKLLAEDTGVTHDQARAFWADPEERERFKRASYQADMAERMPGGGFNAQALNDYMGTVASALQREAGIRKEYEGQLAALRKEVATLQRQLNREEADTPALREPEAPARGAAPRRKAPETMDEARSELARRIGAGLVASE
jgi:hypothetical protein